MKVRDIMKRNVETVAPEEDARSVFPKFAELGIHHLPVIEDGKTVGILTTADYQGAVHDVEKGTPITADMVFGGISVRTLMTRNPLTLPPDAPIESAASMMLQHEIHALPVVSPDGALEGIITATDILAGVASGKL